MTGGMDRLERLFKKRHTASRSASETDRLKAASSSTTDVRFPAPSFIRPKSNKMAPREDSAPTSRASGTSRGHTKAKTTDTNEYRPARTSNTADSEKKSIFRNPYTLRFPSFESPNLSESSTTSTAVSSGSSIRTLDSPPSISPRSSSLQNRRKMSIATLRGSQLSPSRFSSALTTSSGELSPTTTFQSFSTTTSQPQPPQLKLKLSGLQDLHPLFLQSRTDLPPSPADHNDKLRRSRSCASTRPTASQTSLSHSPSVLRLSGSVSMASVPLASTPEGLPQMAGATEKPLRTRNSVVSVVLAQDSKIDATVHNVHAVETTPADTSKPLPPSPATRRKNRASRRPISLRFTGQLPIERAPLSARSVLKEPNLGDFLSLSDDDIAEDEPAAHTETPTEEPKDAKDISTVDQDRHATPTLKSPPAFGPRTPTSVSPASAVSRRPLHNSTPPSRPPSRMAPPPPVSLAAPTLFLSALAMTSSLNAGHPQSPTGQVRMAAAFEIARIASQYKFDLAYIATIWPKNMAVQKLSQPQPQQQSASTGVWSPPSPTSVTAPSASVFARRAARHGSQTSCASSASAGSSIAATHGSDGTMRTTATATATTKPNLGSQGSPAPMSPQSGLEAQFLAAYGLATVQAPYSLSAPTHARILDADRWVEFSEPDAKDNEFFKGYGCAFHRSYAPVATKAGRRSQQRRKQNKYGGLGNGPSFRRPSLDDCDADTEQDDREDSSGRATPRPMRRVVRTVSNASSISVSSSISSQSTTANNRGIVFVAYRRKGSAEEDAGSSSSHLNVHEMDALYRDVESLVDRILDFHMMQQRQEQLEMLRTVPGMADDVLATSAAGMTCDMSQMRSLGIKAA